MEADDGGEVRQQRREGRADVLDRSFARLGDGLTTTVASRFPATAAFCAGVGPYLCRACKNGPVTDDLRGGDFLRFCIEGEEGKSYFFYCFLRVIF